LRAFDYFAPTTLDQAISLLSQYNGQAMPLAGGTDLLIRMKRRQWKPRALVNLKRVPGLRDIRLNDDGLHLGPLVTLADLIHSPVIRDTYPVLSDTARHMAGVQIRNIATVGGNLCNASPAAPPLIALSARVRLIGPQGERVVPLEYFFVGPGKSVLAPGEILAEILVPLPLPTLRATYHKLEQRQAMDIAIVGVAVSVKIRNSQLAIRNSQFAIRHCEDVRIVLGAVAPTPMRAKKAEEVLRGHELTEERIREAARVAAQEAKPIDDVRGSAWYRREMVEVLTRRELRLLCQR